MKPWNAFLVKVVCCNRLASTMLQPVVDTSAASSAPPSALALPPNTDSSTTVVSVVRYRMKGCYDLGIFSRNFSKWENQLKTTLKHELQCNGMIVNYLNSFSCYKLVDNNIINPRHMHKGYSSHSVCLSVTKLHVATTYLVYMLKIRYR